MKIIRNEKLVTRNAQIGKITTILSLAVLGGGMYLTFTRPELEAWHWPHYWLGFYFPKWAFITAIAGAAGHALMKLSMQR